MPKLTGQQTWRSAALQSRSNSSDSIASEFLPAARPISGAAAPRIGDPANKALEILTLKNGNYELHGCAEEKGKLTSPLLPGLEFDLSEIQ